MRMDTSPSESEIALIVEDNSSSNKLNVERMNSNISSTSSSSTTSSEFIYNVKSSNLNEISEEYNFRPKTAQGYGLIINITKIKNQSEKLQRPNSDSDVQSVETLFHKLGVENYTIVHNTKRTNLLKPEGGIISQFISQFNPKFYDFIAVVILSSASATAPGNFFTREGKEVSLINEILVSKFGNVEKLKGVPKIFITQAFHGFPKITDDDKNMNQLTEKLEDILIIHSKLPDFVSKSVQSNGSFYINTLCNVFKENYLGRDILELADLANQQLAKTKLNVDMDNHVTVQLHQAGSFIEFNWKKFLFSPELFRENEENHDKQQCRIQGQHKKQKEGGTKIHRKLSGLFKHRHRNKSL